MPERDPYEDIDARYPEALASFGLPPSHDDDGPTIPGDPEDAADFDPSSELQAWVYPADRSPLSEIERQSVAESVKGFVEFAERKVLALTAEHLLPGFGGYLVDRGFEFLDVATSLRALASDDPVLETPLPAPFPCVDFALEIPLASGEYRKAAPPLALYLAPHTPSMTGDWALNPAERDGQPAHEAGHARQPEPCARRRSATACLVETALDSLQLPERRELRAGVLGFLVTEHASRLRLNPDLARFDLLIIADKGRRCGLWIWLDDPAMDRLFL